MFRLDSLGTLLALGTLLTLPSPYEPQGAWAPYIPSGTSLSLTLWPSHGVGAFSEKELYLAAKTRWETGLGLDQGLVLGPQQICGRTDQESGILSPSLVTQAPDSLEEKFW